MKTTKGGKFMNPTDAYRKELRKRELKRNKKERKKVREVGILKKDPEAIKEQIQKLEMMKADGALDKTRRHKKRQLEDTLNLVLKKRKEYEEKMREKGEEPVMFSHLPPPRRRATPAEEEERIKHLKPEDSVYYHPSLNPSGAPPPGKPPMYKSLIGPRIPLTGESSDSIVEEMQALTQVVSHPLSELATEGGAGEDPVIPIPVPVPPPPPAPRPISISMSAPLPPPLVSSGTPLVGAVLQATRDLPPPPPPPRIPHSASPGNIGDSNIKPPGTDEEVPVVKKVERDSVAEESTSEVVASSNNLLPPPPRRQGPSKVSEDGDGMKMEKKTLSAEATQQKAPPPPPVRPAQAMMRPPPGPPQYNPSPEIQPSGIARLPPPPPPPGMRPPLPLTSLPARMPMTGMAPPPRPPVGPPPSVPRPNSGPAPLGPPPLMRPPPGPPPMMNLYRGPQSGLPPPPPPRHLDGGEEPSKSSSAQSKPSYVKSAAATVVKRPLAQHTPELTSMVPASVRVRRENAQKSRPKSSTNAAVLNTVTLAKPISAPSAVKPQSIDDSYSAFLEDMKALGAFDDGGEAVQ